MCSNVGWEDRPRETVKGFAIFSVPRRTSSVTTGATQNRSKADPVLVLAVCGSMYLHAFQKEPGCSYEQLTSTADLGNRARVCTLLGSHQIANASQTK
jgi:hypothetical protein